MYVTQQPFPLNEDSLALVSGKHGAKPLYQQSYVFQSHLWGSDLFWRQITMLSLWPVHLCSGARLSSCSAFLTSFVVLAVRAEGLHGHVASCPSPPGLANTMPAVLVQCTSSIAIAQTGTTLCRRRQRRKTRVISVLKVFAPKINR